jgi:hypothetical protein
MHLFAHFLRSSLFAPCSFLRPPTLQRALFSCHLENQTNNTLIVFPSRDMPEDAPRVSASRRLPQLAARRHVKGASRSIGSRRRPSTISAHTRQITIFSVRSTRVGQIARAERGHIRGPLVAPTAHNCLRVAPRRPFSLRTASRLSACSLPASGHAPRCVSLPEHGSRTRFLQARGDAAAVRSGARH